MKYRPVKYRCPFVDRRAGRSLPETLFDHFRIRHGMLVSRANVDRDPPQ